MTIKFHVNFADRAINDTNNILSYYNQTYFNPQINNHFLDSIEAEIAILSDSPFIQRVRLIRNKREICCALFMGYLLCYEIDQTKNIINILRVFHQLEDYENKLI
ncbi:type II toxin-antitoxin system RelE/ParE family toxin [Candidatus Stoquefichus sp. SB1]|uniref:type II toxin-antitoxin system RelE/ParE family toxin n=1 Tax=Candidatus Stoquefichus sp. SB1 TaxID=1658109 RepID=UPI00067EECB2|nr:type II toxin-antitoxin system RelE/ParE family toxin [Candidatus Stoquefichus sp. SB1]